jgi:hypothetical protein
MYLKSQQLQTEIAELVQTRSQLEYHGLPYVEALTGSKPFRKTFVLGSLQLVLGCAGSGKTQYLHYLYKKYEPLDQGMLRLSIQMDEDLIEMSALSRNVLETCLQSESYQSSTYIFIEDLHLWEDQNLPQVIEHLATATPNGRGVSTLLPYADHVQVLEAYCAKCKNGTPASFASKSGDPVCRFHGISGSMVAQTPFDHNQIDSFN